MRFLSTLLASFALFNPISAASLTQMLSSSYIVDLTAVDINTDTTLDTWRQYQSVQVDPNNIQTLIISKVGTTNPFNQTIMYEQAKLSGTGSSAMEGPVYDYMASSYVPNGGSRQWTSCSFSSLQQRQPDYCTEVLEVPAKNYTCGRDGKQTCILSEVACRHNGQIMPSMFYKVNVETGEVVEQMESKTSTQVWYWSNLNTRPTSGQFADNILLPARGSCPDNNPNFPAVFGTAPNNNFPTSAPTSTPTSSSSTGSINFNAAPSTSSISAIVLIIPALLSAFFRF